MNDIILTLITNALLPLASFALGWLVQQRSASRRSSRALEAGVRALLKHQIMVICLRCELNGSISFSDNETLNSLYSSYADLGGNGAAKEMYEKARRYPLVTVSYQKKRESAREMAEKAGE